MAVERIARPSRVRRTKIWRPTIIATAIKMMKTWSHVRLTSDDVTAKSAILKLGRVNLIPAFASISWGTLKYAVP